MNTLGIGVVVVLFVFVLVAAIVHWRIPRRTPQEIKAELLEVQSRICQVEDETRQTVVENVKITEGAVDYGSPHWAKRDAFRNGLVSHNRALIRSLRDREARLRRELSRAEAVAA